MTHSPDLPPEDPNADTSDSDVVIEEGVHRSSRRLIIGVLMIACVVLLIRNSPLAALLDDSPQWQSWAHDNWGMASLAFFISSSILLIAGVPRLALFALAGYVFDIAWGLFLAMASSLTGSYLAYVLARWAGRDWIVRRFGHLPYFQRVIHAEPSVTSVAMLRLLPISNALMNAVLAVSRIGTYAFIVGSAIGFLPAGLVAILVGAGFAEEEAVSGGMHLLLAALIVLPLAFFKFKRRRAK